MKILILENDNYMVESKTAPIIGRHYILEDAETGTQKQNKAFHALIQCYWKSRQHSYQAETFDDFKNQIKKSLGEGFESYVYAVNEGGTAVVKKSKKYEDIPQEIRHDTMATLSILGKLKSWADYTKKQRISCIDNLIVEMHEAGVNSKKFLEILEGMVEDKESDG